MATPEKVLRLELEALKLQLQSKDDQLQSKDDQLQGKHEELRAMHRELQATTLDEFLTGCHKIYEGAFGKEQHQSWLTKGTGTKPDFKKCPTRLRQWVSFPKARDSAYQEFFELVNPGINLDQRLFRSQSELNGLKKSISTQPIDSEDDLLSFRQFAVELPLRTMIDALAQSESVTLPSRIHQGIVFSHHTNLRNDSTLADQDPNQKPIHADRFCYAKAAKGGYDLITAVEQKPPHKITLQMLDVGLHDLELDTVIYATKTPTNPDALFKYKATKLVAAALSQEYAYMLEGGLEFSCVKTGEATIFLQIREEDFTTLYYYLALPSQEANSNTNLGVLPSMTALGQFLSFFYMSMQSAPRSQSWTVDKLREAKTWHVNEEKYLNLLTPEKILPAVESLPYRARLDALKSKSKGTSRKLGLRKKVSGGTYNEEVARISSPNKDSDIDDPADHHRKPLRKP